MNRPTIKRYSQLLRFPTFQQRLKYLSLRGKVGTQTFNADRIFNQMFYTSKEWRSIRNEVIARDYGCDLGIRQMPINGSILIHHMNPITVQDIRDSTQVLLSPQYLICVSHETHNAIHYGVECPIPRSMVQRRPNDTCPWR